MQSLAVTSLSGEKLSSNSEDSQKRVTLFSEFAVLFAANYGEPLGDARLALFRAELRDMDTPMLARALRATINNCKRYGQFTPGLADIREQAEKLRAADKQAAEEEYGGRALPPAPCADCSGMGWRIVQAGAARYAVRCSHDGAKLPELPPAPEPDVPCPDAGHSTKLARLIAQKTMPAAKSEWIVFRSEKRLQTLRKQADELRLTRPELFEPALRSSTRSLSTRPRLPSTRCSRRETRYEHPRI